tara:strand:- start:1395 stop:1766 length:372 start_codon:yes stop_codon:yes gene_type:complete
MAGLGSGLGITLASIARTAASTQQLDFLYLTTQDGRILRTNQNRGTPSEPALILFEPNDLNSDVRVDPLDLLLTQDDKALQTQNGRGIAGNGLDPALLRLTAQDGGLLLTQNGDIIASEQLAP